MRQIPRGAKGTATLQTVTIESQQPVTGDFEVCAELPALPAARRGLYGAKKSTAIEPPHKTTVY